MKFRKYIEENIKQNLKDRGIDLKDRVKYPVFIDTKEDVAYFPLYNLSGKMVGYQRYNPKGDKNLNQKRKNDDRNKLRYYSYFGMENDDFKKIKKIGVYGLHTLDSRPYVFITEGVFDAVKLQKLNLPVIAVMANNPKPLKNLFFILQKKIIAILDNDENLSGNKLARMAHKSFKVPSPYNDLGQMPIKEVMKFINTIGIKT